MLKESIQFPFNVYMLPGRSAVLWLCPLSHSLCSFSGRVLVRSNQHWHSLACPLLNGIHAGRFPFFFFFNIHSLSSAAISIRRKEEGHSTAVYRGMLNIFTMQLHLTHLRFIDNLYGLSSSLQRQGNVNLKSLAENKNERQVAGRNE